LKISRYQKSEDLSWRCTSAKAQTYAILADLTEITCRMSLISKIAAHHWKNGM